MRRLSFSLSSLFCLFIFAGACAHATEVAVAGVFGGKAVLVIDGGRPLTVSVGERTPQGVLLVAVRGELAEIEINGERQTLRLGERVVKSSAGASAQVITMKADLRGHFVTSGLVNGRTVRFLVDTGASMVALGRSLASQAGIDYVNAGRPSQSMTANGLVRTWVVKLDTVQVAGVTLHNVDAAVHDSELPVALLGMSFLNRMDMRRNGDTLTLRKRY